MQKSSGMWPAFLEQKVAVVMACAFAAICGYSGLVSLLYGIDDAPHKGLHLTLAVAGIGFASSIVLLLWRGKPWAALGLGLIGLVAAGLTLSRHGVERIFPPCGQKVPCSSLPRG